MKSNPIKKSKRTCSPALQEYNKNRKADAAACTRIILTAVKRLSKRDYPLGYGHIVLTKLQMGALAELAEAAERNAMRRGSCAFTHRGRKYYASLTSWGRVKVSLDIYTSPFMANSAGPVLGIGRGFDYAAS